jgi:hypothetical protein
LKKILLLIPQNVLPVTDGGKAAIYNLMSLLAKENHVKALIFTDLQDVCDINKYQNLNVEPYFFAVNKKDTFITIISNIFYNLPFKFKKYYSRKHQQTINQLCTAWQPNIIICNHAHLAAYCTVIKKLLPTTKFILREYNIEYLLVYQFYKLSKNPLAKLIAYWQYKKTKAVEVSSWNFFDKILFISDTDFELVPKNIIHEKGMVLYESSNVVEHTINLNNKKPYFLFTGKVSVLQNKQNLENFIFNIWIPWKNKYENKDFELWITGTPQNEFQQTIKISDTELLKYKIVIKGFIDNLTDVVNNAYFFLSPTIIGAGIRIKVIEAICSGCVVFLTTIDLKMVKHFKHLHNVVHYTTVDDFNTNFNLLTTNYQLYTSIQNNALTTANNYLSKQVFVEQLSLVLE